MSSRPTVLIVDDEVRSLETLERILEDEFDIQTAENVEQARAILQNQWVQIILCDQRMPDITGVEFLKQVREQWPEVIRMIISGYTDSEDIISAVNEAGIYQFVTKPWHPDSLILLLKNAAELFELQRKNEILSIELKLSPSRLQSMADEKSQRLRDDYSCDDQIVRSSQSCMNKVCEKIRRVSPYDISVLLTGESGTGKELAARALHYNSNRWQQPFVVENCGALPDELLESELFGYKRGAFTGAVEDRAGLFERANGGTVFLDEVGEVSPAFQVKLLRVLQEGEIRPLGSSQTRQVDVRIIAATNRDLEKEVREGRFREDLYYRLATVTIQLPALRDRKMDIPLIANSILESSIKQLDKRVEGFTNETLACMQAYHWPGNVRELQNEIRHMLVMGEGKLLGADLLSPRVLRATPEADEGDIELVDGLNGTLKERVESLEARILKECLIRNRWNKSQAAKELGLSRVGLRSKLERYGLEKIEQLRDDEDMVG
ncbi:MAG: sigma-54 dependent transcriptional regulator [Candidatus Thiodiazotropha sp. (ex. Lucinisca nassula)]|nr:sigma-54 dependent transcriptional regulator [Candidatus Thiodiazotropha sp. (ex. Lucinisca nassula)]MBW9262963.1 sigma-54 dependent transcriptional regulator [Candidatus Thiodiazotropha sp. (ex. Lucinisca nassula)]MBW9271041.1 sigma-54 dependent transcriptional regulator [Candidatus Thiodiazotropha sp. (ex. Lucinisca nassula)]